MLSDTTLTFIFLWPYWTKAPKLSIHKFKSRVWLRWYGAPVRDSEGSRYRENIRSFAVEATLYILCSLTYNFGAPITVGVPLCNSLVLPVFGGVSHREADRQNLTVHMANSCICKLASRSTLIWPGDIGFVSNHYFNSSCKNIQGS